MSLHQDKDELDFKAPIVSVSLGLPATFLFGGLSRKDTPRRYRLEHGDVAVWGGPARLAFHGVAPLKDGEHPLLGRQRINLTFRKVTGAAPWEGGSWRRREPDGSRAAWRTAWMAISLRRLQKTR